MKHRVKKYSDGGDTIDDFAEDANERLQEAANQGRPAKSESYTAEPDSFVGPKNASFKQAFAAARKAGDKTFNWKGKKYTTELAKEKTIGKERTKSVPEPQKPRENELLKIARDKMFKDRLEASDKPLEGVYPELLMIPAGRLAKAAGEALAARRGTKVAEEVVRKEPRLGIPRPIVRAPERVEPTFKKGGSVNSGASKRGDGIAQRGKTKGRIC
jgi:hypothetical protein